MQPHLEVISPWFVPRRDPLLLELEQEASSSGIPIVGPVVGELLLILARACCAAKVLELGAATGYSAIYLARGCEPADGRVLTLERDAAMAAEARDNIARAGLQTGADRGAAGGGLGSPGWRYRPLRLHLHGHRQGVLPAGPASTAAAS